MKLKEILSRYNIDFDDTESSAWVNINDKRLLRNNMHSELLNWYINGPVCVFSFKNGNKQLTMFRLQIVNYERYRYNVNDSIYRYCDIAEMHKDIEFLKKFEHKEEFWNDDALNVPFVMAKLKDR